MLYFLYELFMESSDLRVTFLHQIYAGYSARPWMIKEVTEKNMTKRRPVHVSYRAFLHGVVLRFTIIETKLPITRIYHVYCQEDEVVIFALLKSEHYPLREAILKLIENHKVPLATSVFFTCLSLMTYLEQHGYELRPGWTIKITGDPVYLTC